MIPEDLIEQVRDSADIVGIIGEGVDLKRTGTDYRGPCPFHGGTHRNFAVIPKKGRYYCFVCKASGDIFTWFMRRDGLDYPTAVREVARRSGIVIPEHPTRAGPDPREPLYSAVSAAHDWFQQQLRGGGEADQAVSYLAGRDLTLDEVGPFELGYAPRGSAFVEAMRKLGIGEAVLLEAGLLVRRDDGTILPKYRGRLLFPIHDPRGRLVGFGGRLLGPGEPKYLNSPETPIFKKGSLLFNLHQARAAIRKEEHVIVVEGYFDVIRLVLAGCEQVVAPLGTALTSEQAQLLRRYAGQAVLLLDSDLAGLRATFRAGDELLRHEMRVRVATMPPGEDPDTLVRKGGLAALAPILADAVDVFERKIQILDQKGWFTGVEHRREALDRLLPTIRAARDPITRELYLSLAAERSGVDKRVLEHEAAAEPAPKPAPVARKDEGPSGARPAAGREGVRLERHLLRVLFAAPQWRQRARELVDAAWFDSAVHQELFNVLAGLDELPVEVPPGLSEPAAELWQRLRERAAGYPAEQADAEFDGACRRLELRQLDRENRRLDERIKSATGEERVALLREKQEKRRELRANPEYEKGVLSWKPRNRRAGGRPRP